MKNEKLYRVIVGGGLGLVASAIGLATLAACGDSFHEGNQVQPDSEVGDTFIPDTGFPIEGPDTHAFEAPVPDGDAADTPTLDADAETGE